MTDLDPRHPAENDAGMCGATHQAIDNGAPCRYLAGHLDAGIPHTTANGFWWADLPTAKEVHPCDCPECQQGKHRNCTEQTLDPDIDAMVPCECAEGGHA